MPKQVRLYTSDNNYGAMTGETKADDAHFEKDVMMVYTGKFDSMDGEVEIKDEDIEKLVGNHNANLEKLSKLASGPYDIGKNPPLQLDHSTSAKDTVGRVVGPLKVGEYATEDGKKLKAMFGKVRVLGADNIEKVKDGRWSHVSMGADLETHTLSELTITPFPAAAHAALLSKRRLAASPPKTISYKDCTIEVYADEAGQWHWTAVDRGGIGSSEADAIKQAKAAIDEFLTNNPDHVTKRRGTKMSYKETKEKAEMYAKCKKHLMDEKKMSEEDAEKHLESAKDEELSKMAAEHDEKLKHLAEEEAKSKDAEMKRLAGLSGSKAKLIALNKQMKEHDGKIQLAQKRLNIQVRLSKLRAEQKITPAEIKKLNLDELAGKSAEVIEVALKMFENRQPVIDPGLFGSTKAMNPAKLSARLKSLQMERMELETRLNMPSKRDEALKRLAEVDKALAAEESVAGGGPINPPPMDDKERMAKFEEAYGHMKNLMDAGKHDEAKEHMRKHMGLAVGPGGDVDHMSDSGMPVGPGGVEHMSALAEGHKKLQTEFQEIVKLVGPVFDIKAEELN